MRIGCISEPRENIFFQLEERTSTKYNKARKKAEGSDYTLKNIHTAEPTGDIKTIRANRYVETINAGSSI